MQRSTSNKRSSKKSLLQGSQPNTNGKSFSRAVRRGHTIGKKELTVMLKEAHRYVVEEQKNENIVTPWHQAIVRDFFQKGYLYARSKFKSKSVPKPK